MTLIMPDTSERHTTVVRPSPSVLGLACFAEAWGHSSVSCSETYMDPGPKEPEWALETKCPDGSYFRWKAYDFNELLDAIELTGKRP